MRPPPPLSRESIVLCASQTLPLGSGALGGLANSANAPASEYLCGPYLIDELRVYHDVDRRGWALRLPIGDCECEGVDVGVEPGGAADENDGVSGENAGTVLTGPVTGSMRTPSPGEEAMMKLRPSPSGSDPTSVIVFATP